MDHHVGSAPVVTGSPWEMQHSYLGESPEASGFRLGSLGSGGFHGSWQLHSPEFSSHMFSHAGGNGTELPSSAGQSEPKQLSHAFPGRHPMTSMSKFDSANERMRSLYHRRSETNTNNADKKQFELDLGHIMRGEDSRTTLMIKNIPNKYVNVWIFVLLTMLSFHVLFTAECFTGEIVSYLKAIIFRRLKYLHKFLFYIMVLLKLAIEHLTRLFQFEAVEIQRYLPLAFLYFHGRTYSFCACLTYTFYSDQSDFRGSK